MIDHLLQPLICERFIADARYRKGHLRVVNALPERRVLGASFARDKADRKEARTRRWRGCVARWNVSNLHQRNRGDLLQK